MWKLLIFAFVLGTSCAKVINYKDCGSVGGKISAVAVNPCDDTVSPFPCVLHRGVNYTVNVNFTSTEASNKLTTKVYGYIAGVWVPFMSTDSCAKHNLPCPMISGTSYDYGNSIYCSKAYPKIKLEIKWEVLDDNDKVVFCFVIPSEIKD